MKTILCFLVLLAYLGVNAATTPAIQKDGGETLKNDADDAKNINTENEDLNSQTEDTDPNLYEYDDDTDILDTDYDVKALFDMIEKEIFKRLSDIEKSFEDEENEQVSDEDQVQADFSIGSSDSEMTDSVNDTQNNQSDIEEYASNTQKSEIETENNVTDENAEIDDSKSETRSDDSKDSIKVAKNNDSKTLKDNSQNEVESEILTEKNLDNIVSQKSETKTNENSKTENENNDITIFESEAEDRPDIDNYYSELINSDLADTEILADFISDDDAYSVVDITLPKDTQFEMVKYEKVLNGRKVVLMKLVPVESTVEDNDKLDIESGKADEKKELIIPVKNSNNIQEDTNEDLINNNDKTPTRALNKNLISVDSKTDADSTSEGTKEIVTLSDREGVADDNIQEDIAIEDSGNGLMEKSAIVEDKNISKPAASKEENSKWCICYEKLTDIPWVVRMQMGI